MHPGCRGLQPDFYVYNRKTQKVSFCDPWNLGIDICAQPWGNSTTAHIDCATGWDDRADYGGLDAAGCGVGCANCADYPSAMMHHGDWRDGSRWLRPVGSTTDAMGRRHDLLTGEPWPLPDDARYEYAACYHNTTREQCFGRNICRRICWPGGLDRIMSVDGVTACGDVGIGEAVPDWFPDVFYYGGQEGQTWRPYQVCRRFEDPITLSPPLGVRRLKRMLGPTFPRFGQIPYDWGKNHWPCGPNVLTACAGKFAVPRGSPCASAYALDPNLPEGLEHWVGDSACRNIWNPARIDASAIELAGGPTRPAQAAAAICSLALQHAASETLPGEPLGTRFNRLDHLAYDQVELWSRSFNGGDRPDNDCGVLVDQRTVVTELPDCRAADGRRVTMRVHVLAADLSLYLILWKIYQYGGLVDRLEVEPHARFLASVKLAYTSADPEIVPNPADCSEIPAGVKFVDQAGRTFRPPRVAEWFGYVGHLGIGGTRTYPINRNLLEDQCFSAADGLGTLEIPGWPHRATLDEPAVAWPYLGSVSVWFATRGPTGERLAC